MNRHGGPHLQERIGRGARPATKQCPFVDNIGSADAETARCPSWHLVCGVSTSMWQLVALALTLADGNGAGGTCSCRCEPSLAATAAVAPTGTPEVAAPALAGRSSLPEALPKNALAFNLGVASAIGEIGVTYMVTPLPPIELEVGLGQGYSGTQLSFMWKLSFGSRRHRATTGIGIASTVAASAYTRDNPLWLNVDVLGYEFRADGGLFFAIAAGLFKGLGGGAVCAGDCEGGNQYAGDVTRLVGPQGRLLIGATF